MRNTLIGAVLAVIFVVVVFATAHFVPKSLNATPPAKPAAPALSAKDAAAQITPSFVGKQKIGDWTLACMEPHAVPAPPPSTGGTPQPPSRGARNSSGVAASGPPQMVTIPRCHLGATLPIAGKARNPHRVMMQLLGFKRRLVVFAQVPAIANPGDQIMMQLSTRSLPLPVRACVKTHNRCLAAQIFKDGDEADAIWSTKSLAFVFSPGADGKPRIVKAPAYGLPEGLDAIRRIDKPTN